MCQIKLSMPNFTAETASSRFTSETVRDRGGRWSQELTFANSKGMKETGRS